MRTSSRSNKGRAALLWDESFLWGVMAHKALSANGLFFDCIRADDVRAGKLENYALLFVPGGWASNKMKALGDAGIEKIRSFVRGGGSYVGFCGGAGLATMDGIGLLPVKRRPTQDRVPSFSGPIRLNLTAHALWEGVSDPVFHAWWPSQFVVDGPVDVLATYGDALPDAFSSDINVGDATMNGGWKELESVYHINLDPERLRNEPAVLEGLCGKGKVLLSLVHFDTSGDRNGARVLRNIWGSRGEKAVMDAPAGKAGTDVSGAIADLERMVDDLIELGTRNLLWFRRDPLLLQWRRGVRGLEYCTLQVLVREIRWLLRQGDAHRAEQAQEHLRRLRQKLTLFVEKARQLLVMERFALQNGPITYERCDDTRIQALREELFSRSKSHGGMFKEVADALDAVFFGLLAGQ